MERIITSIIAFMSFITMALAQVATPAPIFIQNEDNSETYLIDAKRVYDIPDDYIDFHIPKEEVGKNWVTKEEIVELKALATEHFKFSAIIYTSYENEKEISTTSYLKLHCLPSKFDYYLNIKECNQLAKSLERFDKTLESYSTNMEAEAQLDVTDSNLTLRAVRSEGKSKSWKYSLYQKDYILDFEFDKLQNSLITAIATLRALKNPQTRVATYKASKE